MKIKLTKKEYHLGRFRGNKSITLSVFRQYLQALLNCKINLDVFVITEN